MYAIVLMRRAGMALFPQRILQPANSILDLPGGLVFRPVGDKFGIANYLAGRFLDSALGLLGRTCDTILVHVSLSPSARAKL